MLLALASCLLIPEDVHLDRVHELEQTQTPTTPPPTTPPPTTPPVVTGVSPAYGTDAGDTAVTVSGRDFGPTPEVHFGAEVARVLSVTAEGVEVETPASPVTGDVDVTVITVAGESTLPASYTYWADAAGLVGATGEIVWFDQIGDIWGAAAYQYGRAVVRFTEPSDYRYYQNWSENLDTCTHLVDGVPEWVADTEVTSIDALAGSAELVAPSATIALDWNSVETRFTNYDLAAGEIVPGEAYDLSVTGTLGMPELSLPAAFTVPAPFALTEPRIDGAPPQITADQHFEWTTDEEGDGIILQIGLLNNAGDGFQEELYCALSDVGSFWVDADRWSNWVRDRQVHVLIGRYNLGEGVIPWNRGRIEVATGLWYYGIGMSR